MNRCSKNIVFFALFVGHNENCYLLIMLLRRGKRPAGKTCIPLAGNTSDGVMASGKRIRIVKICYYLFFISPRRVSVINILVFYLFYCVFVYIFHSLPAFAHPVRLSILSISFLYILLLIVESYRIE